MAYLLCADFECAAIRGGYQKAWEGRMCTTNIYEAACGVTKTWKVIGIKRRGNSSQKLQLLRLDLIKQTLVKTLQVLCRYILLSASPVGNILSPRRALIADDFPLLVLPKKTIFRWRLATISCRAETRTLCSDILNKRRPFTWTYGIWMSMSFPWFWYLYRERENWLVENHHTREYEFLMGLYHVKICWGIVSP